MKKAGFTESQVYFSATPEKPALSLLLIASQLIRMRKQFII
jgi:hypothetical protein